MLSQVAFYFENHLDGCAILAISLPVLAIITGTVYAYVGIFAWVALGRARTHVNNV